jgi:branched-chain amino acid transport system substrate-binding protein
MRSTPTTPLLVRRKGPGIAFVGAIIALLMAALFVVAACGDDDDGGGGGERAELKVGALLDLSGSWSTLGIPSKAALELAADYINSQPDSAGFPRVSLTIVDTKLNPNTALEELRKMHDAGIRVVIGPQSSSEVAAILEYAKESGMIIISQGSTSSRLSTSGDTVFRLPPDDRRETAAIAALLKEDGITTIVPAWRADVGNQGLAGSIRPAFGAVGGKVTPGIEYPATNPNFTTVLDTIEREIAEAQRAQGAKVAIFAASFDELADLLEAASKRPGLASIAWYSTDGAALSGAVTANTTAATYAQRVGLVTPIYGLNRDAQSEARWKPIADQVEAKSGHAPDAFALSAYDGLILAAKAVGRSANTGNANNIARTLEREAANMQGVTGSLKLNDAGDRDQGPFDFWTICSEGSGHEWVLALSYTPDGGGKITKLESCRR